MFGLTNQRVELFEAITPFRQGLLELDHMHRMRWQLSGNPQGAPVVWIHGGPGSSSSPLHRRFFDPEKFLIIQYDQRGCGQSEPRGSIECNTTSDLLADLERLRKALGVSKWSVAAGSWGAALALLYVQAHADVIERVLLRSPFLCTANEIDRYFLSPPKACEPQWEQLAHQCRQLGSASIQSCSYQVFCEASDSQAQVKLARAWVVYEAAMDAYPATTEPPSKFNDSALISRYRIQMHYLQHRCFVDEPILTHAHRLRNVDLVLVHGDQDALCPFDNSLAIQQASACARLVPVTGAGHNMFDERMIKAVFTEIQRWA